MFGNNVTQANFSVDDLETAKKFYCDTLGFTVVRESEGDVTVKSGAGTMINFYHKPDHQAWNATVLGIDVDDVRQAVTELKEKGVSVEKVEGTDDDGVASMPEMGDAAWLKDPAGNWVCIHTPLA
jgi:catechol 2,3-dioxygenase-like lactoylglutathione lyase family enzyme